MQMILLYAGSLLSSGRKPNRSSLYIVRDGQHVKSEKSDCFLKRMLNVYWHQKRKKNLVKKFISIIYDIVISKKGKKTSFHFRSSL